MAHLNGKVGASTETQRRGNPHSGTTPRIHLDVNFVNRSIVCVCVCNTDDTDIDTDIDRYRYTEGGQNLSP